MKSKAQTNSYLIYELFNDKQTMTDRPFHIFLLKNCSQYITHGNKLFVYKNLPV